MATIVTEIDGSAVVKKLSSIIEKCANAAIDAGDTFKIGLSGYY